MVMVVRDLSGFCYSIVISVRHTLVLVKFIMTIFKPKASIHLRCFSVALYPFFVKD